MIRCLTAILLILAAFVPALAASVHADSAAVTTPQVPAQKERVSELAFYEASHSRPLFSWGAEAGANVDLSGNDMSTIALNLSTGLRWRWIRFFGLGAEADITVSNSNRYFPIYAIFRTNFTDKPSRVFAEASPCSITKTQPTPRGHSSIPAHPCFWPREQVSRHICRWATPTYSASQSSSTKRLCISPI